MDVIAYSEAFDKFLIEMENMTEQYSWKIQSILEGVCEILRIGKIELLSYESVRNEEIDDGEMLTYYLKNTPENNASYIGRHVSGRGAVMLFRFYQIVNDAVWTEEELNKIKVLDTALYINNAKIRLTKFAENAIYFDRNLHIPNMSFFHKEARRIIEDGEIGNYAVCFFNLKRYSVVNQLLGRQLGTKVMSRFLVGLQQKLRKNGNVCRSGGDFFVAIFKKSEIDSVCAHLSGEEIVYNNSANASVMVKASAGIYLCSNEADDVEEQIEKAYIALQSAKSRLDNNIVFYNDELQHMHEHASLIENIFRESVDREEFFVLYQPKVQLNDYTIAGAEALCRWRHEGELVEPDDFVPVLEKSNDICVLDFYMLEHVCKAIRTWIDKGLNVVRVSVNFSRRHLGDEKLIDKIINTVDKYEVPHQYIEIEFTETTTDVAFNDLKKVVNGLHDYGIHTSIDDFGVGYSSLNLIRQIAWDVVKIDRSFLPGVSDKTSEQYLMFSHLLSMFRELGIRCIVEGVETIEQVRMLKENKCFLAQGYFFDKPLKGEDFETRLID